MCWELNAILSEKHNEVNLKKTFHGTKVRILYETIFEKIESLVKLLAKTKYRIIEQN